MGVVLIDFMSEENGYVVERDEEYEEYLCVGGGFGGSWCG